MIEEETTFAISEGNVNFDWTAFGRELFYNFFHWLALPIVIYNEGVSGARSRCYWGFNYSKFYTIFAGIISLLIIIVNIIYFGIFNSERKKTYILGIVIMDILALCRYLVIAIKWGYQPSAIFEVMRQQPLTVDQV